MKIFEGIAQAIVGLCLFAYFVPDQDILPVWSLIPQYPIQIGIVFLLLGMVRTEMFIFRGWQYQKEMARRRKYEAE